MKFDFEGKVAFVTGASSGIGRATAEAFAARGASVALVDIDPHGDEVAARLRAEGHRAFYQRCDISDEREVEKAVTRTIEELGSLDFAFNNAGVEGHSAPIADDSIQNWNHVISVNLTGVWNCMRSQIRVMSKARSGAIVNCSSVAGLRGFAGSAPYVASKHGVIGLTKSAALELADKKIRVNAVCPGLISTPMIDRATHGDPAALKALLAYEPVGRAGAPSEVAEAVLWLCSESSSFVTGAALPVDGGWVAK